MPHVVSVVLVINHQCDFRPADLQRVAEPVPQEDRQNQMLISTMNNPSVWALGVFQ